MLGSWGYRCKVFNEYGTVRRSFKWQSHFGIWNICHMVLYHIYVNVTNTISTYLDCQPLVLVESVGVNDPHLLDEG